MYSCMVHIKNMNEEEEMYAKYVIMDIYILIQFKALYIWNCDKGFPSESLGNKGNYYFTNVGCR